MGSVVTNAFSDSATNLVANGSLVGMGVASFLIWNATFMGKKFDEYTSSGYIVGGDSNQYAQTSEALEEQNIQMATVQNEAKDTSCAIEDDDEIGAEEEGQSDEGNENDDGKGPEVSNV